MRKNILSLLSAIAIFCGCLFTFPHNAAASTYLNKDSSPVTDGRIIVEFKKLGGVSDDSCLMWVTDSPSEGNKRRWNTTLSMSATALRVKATDEKICDFNAVSLAHKLSEAGVKTVIYTDIMRSVAHRGPSIDNIRELIVRTNLDVIAAGGIYHMNDLEDLKKAGVSGAIIAAALYEGKIKLSEAAE